MRRVTVRAVGRHESFTRRRVVRMRTGVGRFRDLHVFVCMRLIATALSGSSWRWWRTLRRQGFLVLREGEEEIGCVSAISTPRYCWTRHEKVVRCLVLWQM